MSQEQHNTNAPKCEHLNFEERKTIERMRKRGVSKAKIAMALERDLSTIKREIRRGSVVQRRRGYISKDPNAPEFIVEKVYFAEVAQRNYEENRRNCGKKNKVVECAEMVKFVEQKIRSPEKWSPDAAIGYAVANKLFSATFTTKTFYNWIDDGLVNVNYFDLHLKLQRKPKKKRKERKRQLGKSIDERPREVENREEFGHWEGDGIVGKGRKGQIITLVERKLGIGMMFNVGDRKDDKIIEVLERLKAKYGDKFSKIHEFRTKGDL